MIEVNDTMQIYSSYTSDYVQGSPGAFHYYILFSLNLTVSNVNYWG